MEEILEQNQKEYEEYKIRTRDKMVLMKGEIQKLELGLSNSHKQDIESEALKREKKQLEERLKT